MTGRVEVQQYKKHWAYAIHRPGHFPFVSAHRYRSAEAALAAGQSDLDSINQPKGAAQ